MEDTIRDVMTSDPVTLSLTASVTDAARLMEQNGVGDIVVLRNGKICGIVTDRDLVVRVLAEDRNPKHTKVSDACSTHLITVGADEPVTKAVELMSRHALRRLPVVEDERPIGIVSMGDLAVAGDPNSALAAVSAAPPNG